MGPLGPRVCYILSDCTEKQSIIRMAPRQRRERGQGDRSDGGRGERENMMRGGRERDGALAETNIELYRCESAYENPTSLVRLQASL